MPGKDSQMLRYLFLTSLIEICFPLNYGLTKTKFYSGIKSVSPPGFRVLFSDFGPILICFYSSLVSFAFSSSDSSIPIWFKGYVLADFRSWSLGTSSFLGTDSMLLPSALWMASLFSLYLITKFSLIACSILIRLSWFWSMILISSLFSLTLASLSSSPDPLPLSSLPLLSIYSYWLFEFFIAARSPGNLFFFWRFEELPLAW